MGKPPWRAPSDDAGAPGFARRSTSHGVAPPTSHVPIPCLPSALRRSGGEGRLVTLGRRRDSALNRARSLGDGAGFLIVTTAALLLIVGLWAIARHAPSAESDLALLPTPLPSPTAAGARARFGLPAYPTARPVVSLVPVTPGSNRGMPGRRAPSPTATVWKLIVGAVRSEDISGGLAGPATAQAAPPAQPLPSSTHARTIR